MTGPRDERFEALERKVEDLQEQILALQGQARGRGSDQTRTDNRRRSSRPKRERPKRERSASPILPNIKISPEELLKWAGIGLVLIALGLLFKYSVDMGWLTPGVRIVIGFIAGLLLLGLGFQVHEKRPRYGQVLQGGGIATFYITLFASFQVLDVLPYEAAFVGMVSITAIALTMALWQDDAGLAVFGLFGGLATPFLLYTGRGDVSALVSYASLLLTATTAIYLWKGWRSMLYATVIGGWAVFMIAANELSPQTAETFGDHLAVQMSAVFILAAFWVAPVVRAIVAPSADAVLAGFDGSTPDSGANASGLDPTAGAETGVLARLEWMFRNLVHLLILITPLVASAITNQAWRLSDVWHGTVMIVLAVLFAGAAAYLTTIDRDRLAYTHWLTVGILITIGMTLILDGDSLIVGLAIEALILHVLATRLNDRWLLVGGHFVAIILAFWVSSRLDHSVRPPALVNMTALSDMVVIAAGLAASFAIKAKRVGLLYRVVTYIAMLAWFSRELEGFDNGQAYVTAVWSIFGVALLVAGLTRTNSDFRTAGLVTLAVVVVKLFLVDLAELDPIWRILLFMGIGAGFLLLGWFVPGMWGRTGSGEQESASGEQESASGSEE